MERWIGTIALTLVVGLLAAILLVLLGLGGGGIQLRLAGPIEIQGATGPQELRVVLTVPEGVRVEAGGEAQATLRTSVEGQLRGRGYGAGEVEPVYRGDHLALHHLRLHPRGATVRRRCLPCQPFCRNLDRVPAGW